MYTQGYSDSVLTSHTSRTAENSAAFLLPHLSPTARVLDIGCGPGTITTSFSRYVKQGSVLGVDFSASVVDKARKRLEELEEACSNVTFEVASVYELPFPDDSFDVVYAHQVLFHLDNAAGALKEMRRVCKVGGLVACREGDWDTTMVHPSSDALELWKTLARRIFASTGADPNTGRRLIEWALQAGYDHSGVEYSSSNMTYASPNDAGWWGQSWSQRSAATEWRRQALDTGLATEDQIDQIAPAWQHWSEQPFSVYAIVCGQVLLRK